MAILILGSFRSERFKPVFQIRVQAALVIVDEDTCGDVHRVDEAETFSNFALFKAPFHFARDVDECRRVGISNQSS